MKKKNNNNMLIVEEYILKHKCFPNNRNARYYADRIGQWIFEYECECSTSTYEYKSTSTNDRCTKHNKGLIIQPFQMGMNDFILMQNLGKVITIPNGLAEDARVTDHAVFGIGEWIYCDQHLRPHMTGWCSVNYRNKVGLSVSSLEEAYTKCKLLGLQIYKEPIKD